MDDILKKLLEKADKGKVVVAKGRLPMGDMDEMDEDAEEVKEEAAKDIAEILGVEEGKMEDFVDALERFVMACY